jgi:hypothetical protein
VGLFTGLLTLPLAPVRGVVWVADQVAQEAERQLYDEGSIRAELVALELAAEEEAMSDEEIRAREDELLERLAISRSRPARPGLEPTPTDLEETD